MRQPAPKTPDLVVPPQFVQAVHDRLREYDGMRTGEERPCPGCSSTSTRKNGYQAAGKTFARLVTADGFEEVALEVQQYECKLCSRSFQGDLSEFFYEDCAYARPVVDLCRFHAVEDSYQAVERKLQQCYGLQVDRDTIERYNRQCGTLSDPRGKIDVDGSSLSLPFLAFVFGESLNDNPHFALSSHTALW
jgi:transposase-like protein